MRANPDRRLALGILTTRLAALCEDLLSIGAAATDVEPLDKLLTLLRSLNDGPIDEAFAEAESVLSKFAGERAAAFWK